VFGKSLTAGEFGVYCSHVEVMFDVMKNRYKSVVVFEDDVVLPNNFAQELKKIERSMPNYKKYDMIFLSYNKIFSPRWLENKFKVKKFPFNDALEAVTSHRGLVGSVYAHMYGYPGAERRLSYLQPRAGIDMDSFRLANSDLIKTFKARHINVEHTNNMVSQITDMGRGH
jgi:GR25 family glycosyltransferase involved in LPS biosynthesis